MTPNHAVRKDTRYSYDSGKIAALLHRNLGLRDVRGLIVPRLPKNWIRFLFLRLWGNTRARRTRQPYLELDRAEYVPVPPEVFGLVAPVAISHTVRWIPVPNGLTSTSARTDHRRSTNALASWASGSRRR